MKMKINKKNLFDYLTLKKFNKRYNINSNDNSNDNSNNIPNDISNNSNSIFGYLEVMDKNQIFLLFQHVRYCF